MKRAANRELAYMKIGHGRRNADRTIATFDKDVALAASRRITRRAFLALCGAALAAGRASALAQDARRIPRVGVIGSASASSPPYEGLRQGLRELGYVEGKNVHFEWRFADGQYERLPGFAAELLRLGVDVIHAGGSPSVRAAQQATRTVPIVFAGVGDPIALGFVASLGRPGGNITGVSLLAVDISRKSLEFLLALIPRLSRVAVLLNPANPIDALVLRQIHAAAKESGVAVAGFEAANASQIDAAFGAIAKARPGALIVAPDPYYVTEARRIAELCAKSRIPTIFSFRQHVDAGGLMSYGESLAENYRRSAAYVRRILNGAKPRDLPVEQPTRVGLVINRKTARALGLSIPQELLLRAEEVIE